jgi:hypothetical protein
MLDFSELSDDGRGLELLVRELLFTLGTKPHWTGVGPDGGKDLVCMETANGEIGSFERKWVVSCKHKKSPSMAVGIGDVSNIMDLCKANKASGYLLVCSTHVSSAVSQRLAELSSENNGLIAKYWDAVQLETLLRTPRTWSIAQQFFPISAAKSKMAVFATESSNVWIGNYKGYYLYLANRIGSRAHPHLAAVERVVIVLERLIPKVPNHHVRLRGLYYDDKNGNYVVYADYLFPHGDRQLLNIERALYALGDGVVAEDGQSYSWDLIAVAWNPLSDHADKDHDDYYYPHAYHMRCGAFRNRLRARWIPGEDELVPRNSAINDLASALKTLRCISRVLRVSDCTIERLYQLHRGENWQQMLLDHDSNADRLLSSELLLDVLDRAEFIRIMNTVPQGIEKHFTVAQRLVFTPDGYSAEDKSLYMLKLSLHDCLCTTPWDIRRHLDEYAREVTAAVRAAQA